MNFSFIILPLFHSFFWILFTRPFFSSLLDDFLIGVILCAGNLSQVLSRPCTSLCFPPSRLPDATVTSTSWHLTWGLMRSSLAMAVSLHPLKCIYPNLRWSQEAPLSPRGTKGNMKTDIITHTFSLLSTWCHVVCSSPWKQTVPHCSPLIHSLVLPFISSLALSLCFKAGHVGQSTLLTVAPSANIYPLLITISLGASSLRAYSSVSNSSFAS